MPTPPGTALPDPDAATPVSTPNQQFKWPLLVTLLLLALGFLFLGVFLPGRSGKSQALGPVTQKSETTNQIPIKVHVVGAVNKPGLYEFKPNQRIDDAINRAGGATPNANLNEINLSAFLEDGKQIKVPSVLDAPSQSQSPKSTASFTPNDFVRNPLNLNTATREQLETLPFIGIETAERIIELRKKKGKFTSVSELREIPGLGRKTFEKLHPLVVVN